MTASSRALAAAAGLFCLAFAAEPTYKVKWTAESFTSFDGTKLHFNVGVPEPKTAGEVFPAIVLSNSWAVPSIEYLVQQVAFAERGYVVLEYETRGFYGSGGQIGTAGPDDIRDHKAILDMMLSRKEWPVNPAKIGVCGISYGGGMSGLVGALDERVSTVMSLSGWGNLTTSLWDQESPSLVWGEVLIGSAYLTGKVSPELQMMYDNLMGHKNVSGVLAWAGVRSPETYLEALQRRKVPVFISNNFEDRLFKPDAALTYFQHLGDVPKMILLNQGIHASAEIGGLLGGKDNFVWKMAQLWADYWLRGEPTGIMDQPQVQMESRTHRGQRVTFSHWPSEVIQPQRYQLLPRGRGLHGGLSASGTLRSADSGSDTIAFSKRTGMDAGAPIVGEILQVFVDVPIVNALLETDRRHSIYYTTAPLEAETRICGIPNVTLSVTANQPSFQVVAYLYSVDFLGVGTLMSHGPRTVYADYPNSPTELFVGMRALCEDLPKGRRLALGINLYSDCYKPANTDPNLQVSVNYGAAAAFLDLPLNAEAAADATVFA